MNGIRPPLDVHDFRLRGERIRKAREKAAEEADEERIKEGEAEHRYRRLRAQAFNHFRVKEGMGVTEAEIMADGSERVTDAKLERHMAQSLRHSAEERIVQMDRNAAMLNREAQMSRGIE